MILRKSLLGALLLLTLAACKKSNDDVENTENVGGNLVAGNWRVGSFNDSGQDETAHFNNYTFTFANNGSVTATNGTVTANGNWGAQLDDGTSKLVLSFAAPLEFIDLSEDWKVVSSSSSRIELVDDNSGGSSSSLVFQRN